MVRDLKNMMLRGFGLVCLFMVANKAYAKEFAVGGSKGWTVPSGSQVYSQWAEQSRFQIGDSLRKFLHCTDTIRFDNCNHSFFHI